MGVRTGVITGSRIAAHAQGARPGRILQVVITDVRDTQNVQTFQAGEEFSPTNGCVAVLAPAGDAYKVLTELDDGITPVMEPGGKRIYATDPDGAAEVAEVRLLPSGEVQAFNDNAAITIAPDGSVSVGNDNGGATLSPAGVWTFHGTATHFDHPVTMESTLAVQGTVSAQGAVSSDVSVTAPTVAGTTDVTFAGKSALTHTHGATSPYTTAPV